MNGRRTLEVYLIELKRQLSNEWQWPKASEKVSAHHTGWNPVTLSRKIESRHKKPKVPVGRRFRDYDRIFELYHLIRQAKIALKGGLKTR